MRRLKHAVGDLAEGDSGDLLSAARLDRITTKGKLAAPSVALCTRIRQREIAKL